MTSLKQTLLADIIDAEKYRAKGLDLRFMGLPVAYMSRDELLAVIGFVCVRQQAYVDAWEDDEL